MSKKQCSVEGCKKKYFGGGFCSAHYSKYRKYGDPLAGKVNLGGTCEFLGCNSKVKAHRLCATHSARKRKHGDPAIKRNENKCSIEGCEEKYKGKGYCHFHYGRLRQHGDPLAGGQRRLSPNTQGSCKAEGCEKNAVSLHYCSNHFNKFKKYGDPLGGYVQDGRSKEWHTNNIGYVIRFDPLSPHAGGNKLVLQHRQVMGEAIGRPLRSDENVHHKNGDRTDNRLENLELWIKGQPAGQRVQDKVKWAREIMSEYGDLVDRLM